MDATFILRLPSHGDGVRVAVKDILDVAGTVTTAGSAVIAKTAVPASRDAVCLAGLRAAGARIVGKANLHELAYGADGINPVFGTPVNPLDATRIPGGSSSGSAVAVATGEADVAIGTDTGGSVRIPAACCGVVGLKTTLGRISTLGCRPLAPSLDTIGPLAATVSGVRLGMELLEPGFDARVDAAVFPTTIGRLRFGSESTAAAEIERAVDDALAFAKARVVDVAIPGWIAARDASLVILLAEAWDSNHTLLDDADSLTPGMARRISLGADVRPQQLLDARSIRVAFIEELRTLFKTVDVIALPTLGVFPPVLADAANSSLTALTRAANISGAPALALPIPVTGATLPASLQLIGPLHGEETLVKLGEQIEGAMR